MTILEPPPEEDPFERFCRSMGVVSDDDKARLFELYIFDTTGWEGPPKEIS